MAFLEGRSPQDSLCFAQEQGIQQQSRNMAAGLVFKATDQLHIWRNSPTETERAKCTSKAGRADNLSHLSIRVTAFDNKATQSNSDVSPPNRLLHPDLKGLRVEKQPKGPLLPGSATSPVMLTSPPNNRVLLGSVPLASLKARSLS